MYFYLDTIQSASEMICTSNLATLVQQKVLEEITLEQQARKGLG